MKPRFLFFLPVFMGCAAVASAAQLYFTGTGGPSGLPTGEREPTIWVGNTDGTTPATVLFSGAEASPGRGGPVGIVESQGELFWGTGRQEKVFRGKADGTGTPSALPNSDPVNSLVRHDVAVDRENNRYFFTGAVLGGVADGLFSANLDGSGTPSNIVDPIGAVTSVIYDPANDRLYYSAAWGDDGWISTVKPDGTGAADLHAGPDLFGIRDIAIDFDKGLIYYVNLRVVGVANLNGTGSPSPLYEPVFARSIDVDPISGDLFWVVFVQGGEITDSVNRANADGTGVVQTLYAGDFDGVRGIAVQRTSIPGPTAALQVDGINCTLIDAIIAANTDTAIGGCPGGSGADTLVLRPGSTHTLDSFYDDFSGPTGLPVITSEVRIEGNGATIRREATAPAFRILAVSSSDLTLHGVTVTGGIGTFDERYAPGGGLWATDSTITIRNSTISGNSGSWGGGIATSGGGPITITNSTISGNTGRGAFFGYSTRDSASVVIMNSTISGNTRGGIAVWGRGPTTIANSTISGNTALIRHYGGGVLARGGEYTSEHLAFDRSIVAGNTAKDNSQVLAGSFVTVTADNYNLFGTDGDAGVTGFTPGASDIVPAEGVQLSAILNPNLADNGGPTLTHALVTGSPAIDAIPASADCGVTDQRGESRPQDGNGDGVPACDIGAYEVGGIPLGDGPGDGGVPRPRPSKAMPWIPLLLED